MRFEMPKEGWGSITPRRWQGVALPKIINAYKQANSPSGVVRAVTGAGKANLMAQSAACCQLEEKECVVVSTSSIFLVEQLEETFQKRLDAGFMSGQSRVGTYYTGGKDYSKPIIITCTPSLPEVAKRLQEQGRTCAMWIADEIHRTRSTTVVNAHAILQPQRALGFGATPFRAKESESLTLFDTIVEDYTSKQAIADKVVVPFRSVFYNGGDGNLDEVCIEMTGLAKGPGMFNAVSIDDSEVFCMKLNDAGILSQTIHSKMPKSERKRRIEDLRTGKLQALVHVSILQEGADLPWLRWLCQRRPTGSRVRYLQELGRILRAYTDPETGEVKEEAVVYDPHCLQSNFNMTYEEVLGGDYEEEEEAKEGERDSEKKAKHFEQMIMEVMREIVNVRAGKKPLSLAPLSGYLVELCTAFDLCGLITRKIANKDWRMRPSTQKQCDTAAKIRNIASSRHVPKLHQRPLQMLVDHAKDMNRGMTSDLLSVFTSLIEHKKWPDLKILDRSAAEATRAHNKRTQDLVQKPFTTPVIALPKRPDKKKPDVPWLFEKHPET